MTGAELRAARERLGWSRIQLAAALGWDRDRAPDRLREMEDGKRIIHGPMATAVGLLVLLHEFVSELERLDTDPNGPVTGKELRAVERLYDQAKVLLRK